MLCRVTYQSIPPSRRLFLTSTTAGLATQSLRSQQARPNLVIILTDDQGWWDVPSNGNPYVETPHLDRLAREGVQFTQFYACPVCAPTRASLMTGRHYLRTGVYNTRFGGDHLDPAERTLPQILAQHGYRTGLFGKWHLGQSRKYHPNQRGFHDALSFAQGHTERYFYPDQLTWNGRPVAARGYISDILTDGAIQFIESNRSGPFFAYLAFNAPHSPNYIDNGRAERYLKKGVNLVNLNDAQIYGMIQRCDENIGRLLARLDELQIADNTVVLFLSDNGGVSRQFKGGLRGAKASAFEGGVRVPFYARWPGHFPAGVTVTAPVMVADILPTFCELAGLPVVQGRGQPALDGRSLTPLLKSGQGLSPVSYTHLTLPTT
jgi:arylsulfatase A-like enzyme